MNHTEARQHAAELVIALCLCGGGWYFLVKPANERLLQTRAEIASLEAQRSAWAANDLPADQARDMLSEASARARAIDGRSAPARDESVMFTTVMDMAMRQEVRVDQLSPGSRRTTPVPMSLPAPVDPGAPPQPVISDTASSYTLTVTAPYPALANFLSELQKDLGYTVVRSVRLSPAEAATEAAVTATIITEHLAFDTSPVWKAVAAAPTLTRPDPNSPAAPAQTRGE